MAEVYFEDLNEGQEIPQVVLPCDSQRLVLWAAGSGDYYQIHYDKDFAQGTGLPDRITHGALKHALLGRMLHQWTGDAAAGASDDGDLVLKEIGHGGRRRMVNGEK